MAASQLTSLLSSKHLEPNELKKLNKPDEHRRRRIMIGYIEGTLMRRDEDHILLLTNHIGYEILLPAVVMRSLKGTQVGDTVSLYIYHQQTERQPKPILIGFNLEVEKEFFQRFISVEDIGPLKAARALTRPIREIASAIESKDVGQLKQLKGIGIRTAQKIVASLEGKMGKFALLCEDDKQDLPEIEDLEKQVIDVLVNQLGHKIADARAMVGQAIEHGPAYTTAEELFDAVYYIQKNKPI
jgi:holliday junction DNA helicase RuvA